jgi:hypothetical protein
MRRHANRLNIAIVSASECTAGDHAERINMHGQTALIFPHATALARSLESTEMDLILLDRGTQGFAMALGALRMQARRLKPHCLICGFGTAAQTMATGLDHAFGVIVEDHELSWLLAEVTYGHTNHSDQGTPTSRQKLLRC